MEPVNFYKTVNRYYMSLNQNNNLFYVALLLLALCYLATAMQLPVTIRSHTFHDDYLFWVNGNHIYNGDWLGPYSQMTLAKGAGFPLFLALNAHLGFPITLSIALFNLVAFYFAGYSLIKVGVNRTISILAITLALFNPFLFPTHIIRDNIYPAATLIVVFSFAQLCFFKKTRLIYAGLSGIFLGFFWIIREEGIWIVPGLLLLFVVHFFLLLKNREFSLARVNAANIGTFIISSLVFIQIISAINLFHYNFYGTVDFKEEYYKKSVNILNSIEPKKRLSHVPVSEEQRKIAYSVSPAFAELEKYFEITGKGWTQHLCASYEWTCGDYAGGMFIWAYRDAVAELGYYKSGDTASAFYKRIYTEIEDACAKKKIECNDNPFGFLPKLTQEQINLAPASFFNAIDLITHKTHLSFDLGPSTAPYDRLAFAELFLRNPLISPPLTEEKARLIGWFYHQGDAWPTLHCSTHGDTEFSTMARQPSPDILKGTGDPLAAHQRFIIALSNTDACTLNYEGASLNLQDVIISGGGRFSLGGNKNIHFDNVIISPMTQFRKESSELKSKLIQIYKVIIPILIGIGLIVFIVTFIFQLLTRKLSFLSVLTLGLWSLCFTRISILILVDISSFPAIQAGYMGPVFPLLALASILSIVLTIKFTHQKILIRSREDLRSASRT